ncbi:autoinducer 2 ABC transporter substrate-binding protein [Cryobacterium sp.]|uniref:autoinducer 2 ABC transporter substrate-binding protein n=1 Tax=Cryobacterium sp. TaxID=1926290 RepID=UPI00260423F8|nr:autoinducer 2 ABC transporter substrate-binding protein [Cryobacterium sp.]
MIHTRKVLAAGAIALIATMTFAGYTTRNDDSGGGSAGSTSGSDEPIRVAFVPKLQGIPYFEAMDSGGQKAAEELGIEWLYQGPTTADAAAQADIVRSFIQQDVDALIVAPNDPDSMAPLLQEAADKGIQLATSDTDAPDSVREVFVNQASVEGIGQALTDSLMTAMGGSGKYAIVSCGEIVDIVYAGEDQAAATSMATDLMNANPDLTGLVGECTSSAPGVAQAVKDAGKIGSVFTVGLGTPMSMAPYLEDGSSSASILWDVQNLGYLTAWAGLQLAEGNEFEATNDVSDDLSAVEYDADTKVLLLGPPLEITKDNVAEFDY